MKGDVPGRRAPGALRQGERVRGRGTDVTIVTYSRMVHYALEAAPTLAKEGIEAEVIDLRTLNPLDMDTVLASVRKTRRALVLNEAHRTAGFCSELAARITEEAFDALRGARGPGGGQGRPGSRHAAGEALDSQRRRDLRRRRARSCRGGGE